MGKEGILLGLIKSVDLIHKKDRGFLSFPANFGSLFNNFPEVLDPGSDRRKGLEWILGILGHETGQGRLPGTRGSPKDYGEDTPGFKGLS
jgi:hypothetical protein